jgi:hypothetical protein
VAESFPSPAAFRKAQAEVHEYQRFQSLCAQLVEISERICRLRPVEKQPEHWSAEEKKRLRRSINQEIRREVDSRLPVVFAERRKTGALDIEATEFTPGVRRMLALVGGECSSFDQGRQQMELPADLKVSAKAVERVSANIGADIAHRQQLTIQQAMQLELPVAVGQPTAVMYVQMDATSVPMVGKETAQRGTSTHHRHQGVSLLQDPYCPPS